MSTITERTGRDAVLLTRHEAALILGVCDSAVSKLARRGKLSQTRTSRGVHPYYLRTEVEARRAARWAQAGGVR